MRHNNLPINKLDDQSRFDFNQQDTGGTTPAGQKRPPQRTTRPPTRCFRTLPTLQTLRWMVFWSGGFLFVHSGILINGWMLDLIEVFHPLEVLCEFLVGGVMAWIGRGESKPARAGLLILGILLVYLSCVSFFLSLQMAELTNLTKKIDQISIEDWGESDEDFNGESTGETIRQSRKVPIARLLVNSIFGWVISLAHVVLVVGAWLFWIGRRDRRVETLYRLCVAPLLFLAVYAIHSGALHRIQSLFSDGEFPNTTSWFLDIFPILSNLAWLTLPLLGLLLLVRRTRSTFAPILLIVAAVQVLCSSTLFLVPLLDSPPDIAFSLSMLASSMKTFTLQWVLPSGALLLLLGMYAGKADRAEIEEVFA